MTRLEKPLKRVWRSLWLAGSFLLFIPVGVALLKVYEDSMRTRERGRLVSSIVDQQFQELSSASHRGGFVSLISWSDDSIELKRWVIQQSLSGADPEEVIQKLRELRLRHPHSANLDTSLNRWQEALQSWEDETHEGNLPPDAMFEQAKQRYFEASGYKKIGRTYDATVLYLWTISLLTRYVDRTPFEAQVPEALFMLGVAYLNLGQALPPRMRGDRILNLCSELYPDSFWANRATGIWREAVSDEI